MSRIEEILATDGRLVYKIKGVSMLPMLRQNRDVVVIVRPKERLKKYDVALYKRDRSIVLHRVIKVKENGYLIRGDNTYALEDIPDESVIGVLTEFKRNGRECTIHDPGYRCYARIWNALYPMRWILVKLKHGLRSKLSRLMSRN